MCYPFSFCRRLMIALSLCIGVARVSVAGDGVEEAPQGDAAKRIVYIHGDISKNGVLPSGDADPFDQMLLTDTGSKGLSAFKALVEAEGYVIEQFYDQDTTLDEDFLSDVDAVVFGLHQKIWSESEINALDAWLRAGGGALGYSDSASGGRYNLVGIDNPMGQNVFNNLFGAYGLQVTVDQGGGTRAYEADGPGGVHPIVEGPLVLEGEGVSVVAVDPNAGVDILIPFTSDNQVSGGGMSIGTSGVTIQNPLWAAMALQSVGEGHVLALFDRQPMWNSGPGSDITQEDNTELLRRSMRFLVGDLTVEPPGLSPSFTVDPDTGPAPLEVEFDAGATTVLEGPVASYAWDFQDDGVNDASGVATSHTFNTPGQYTIRLAVTDALGESASTTRVVTVTGQAPFGNDGNSWPLPGRVQAEDFDLGGPDVAYNDTTASNQGNSGYRGGEQVDIEDNGDVDGGLNIGYITDGEWLEYSVMAAESGSYRFSFRAASQSATGSVEVWVDGVKVAGPLDLPPTGDWQSYETRVLQGVPLAAGARVVRLVFVSGSFNLNWWEAVAENTEPDGEPPSAPGDFTATPGGATRVDLAWSAATDNIGVVAYEVKRDGALIAELPASALEVVDTGLEPKTTYTYSLAALDAAGNRSSEVAAQAVTPVAPPLPTDSLVAFWPFDEADGSTVINAVDTDLNGTLNNVERVEGQVNGALRFNGDSSIVTLPTFDVPGGGITLSAWMRFDGTATSDGRILSKATSTNPDTHIFALGPHDNGRLRARLTTDGSTTELFTPDNAISVNTWHHVVLRYDGAALQILVDGDLAASTPASGDIPEAPGTPVAIGNQPPGAGDRPFSGALDQIRLYARALDDAELSALRMEASFSDPDSFANWRQQNFTPSQLADPEISGPFAIPAGDSVTNLFKYHLGLDPFTPVTGEQLPRVLLNPPDAFFGLEYRRRESSPGAIGRVEWATELSSPIWNDDGVQINTFPADEGKERVEAVLPINGRSPLFLRLNVDEPSAP